MEQDTIYRINFNIGQQQYSFFAYSSYPTKEDYNAGNSNEVIEEHNVMDLIVTYINDNNIQGNPTNIRYSIDFKE